ncbi:hypothetical protein F2Q69_00027964 [Brassica cretica]|uniref:Uncharacterized protein n=1 Tax=Brassica cretica TaxID=69181 RepID=A0A8S9RWX1_BRACR|nr:hypothetical protein F2Q69_00027964 [Brassica cretica]
MITPPKERHEVEFRISERGERADDPPDGYFTCYEAYLVRCRLCFLILEAMIQALNRFELSITQLNLNSLQHLIGILIRSYEHGMVLNASHFEAVLRLQETSSPFIFCMVPRNYMSTIKGTISNGHAWNKCTNTLPPFPGDVIAKRDLLRNGLFYWTSFNLKIVRKAVALHRSRAHPQSFVEVKTDSDMDEPSPHVVPVKREIKRERNRSPKNKGIALGDDDFPSNEFALPGWDPGFILGDGNGPSEIPLLDCGFDDFFAELPPGFDVLPAMDEPSRTQVVAKGSRMINEAEHAEKWLIRLQTENSERDRQLAKEHAQAILRGERKVKREIVAAVGSRASQFSDESSKQQAQDLVGDLHECWGSVGTLWKTQDAEYSFHSEWEEMMGAMGDYAYAESMVSPNEGRIQRLWDPISVSPDTEKAGVDIIGKDGEVDQPSKTFGASMSRDFELDPEEQWECVPFMSYDFVCLGQVWPFYV